MFRCSLYRGSCFLSFSKKKVRTIFTWILHEKKCHITVSHTFSCVLWLKNGVVVDHPKFLNLTAQNYTDHTISDLLVKFPHSPILL